MNPPHQQLRVTVVGTTDIAVDLDDTECESGQRLSVSTVRPAALANHSASVDCFLIDKPTVDSWRTVLDRLTSDYPQVPVVVLIAERFESTVATAAAAGVADYLPRSLCDTQPSLVADRILSATDDTSSPMSVDGLSQPETEVSDRSEEYAESEIDGSYRSLFEGVSDGLVIHDPETGRILDCNRRFCEMTDYSRAELIGQTVDSIVAATENYSYRQARELIRRTSKEGPQLFEWFGKKKNGEAYPTEVHLDRVSFGDSECVVASVRDITDRREQQRRLTAARDRRSILFENNPDPVMAVGLEDGTPHIAEVNSAFEEIFGFDAEAVADQPLADIIVPEGEHEQYERIRDRAISGESLETEVRRTTAEGIRDFLIRVLPFETDGERYAYVWYTDVTERRRHEQAIKALQEATERMQRADSCEAVASVAVEAARDALGVSMAACWFHDGETTLDPVAATETVDSWDSLPVGSDEYTVFEMGEITHYSSQDEGPVPLTEGLLLPLGDHGLLAVGGEEPVERTDVIRDVAGTLAEGTETALSRLTRATELRRSERRLQAIIDRIDEAIFLAPMDALETADRPVDFVSSGYEDIWGQPLEGLHEQYEEGLCDTIHPNDQEGYMPFIQRLIADAESGGSVDTYSREYRIKRPDGEVRWVHSDYYPIEWSEGSQRVVIVSRDITDRKQRDRTLESFHDATAELTTADTVDAASRIAVEAAADVFDLPATAVYHYNDETAQLDPRATGPELPEATDLPPLSADQSDAWEAFVSDRMDRIDVGDDSPLAVGPADDLLVVPLGGTGLLAVWRSDETFDTDAASILAATVAAAFNRLRGERQLESRQAELAAQTERAQRLDAVAELTQRVEAAITTTSSREGIQEAVCAELVDVDPFFGSWIAAAEVGTERLTPRAVAGVDSDHVEQVLSGGPDGTDPHPAVEAWQTGEPRVINDLVGSGRRSSWRQLLLKAGVGSVCAVPLAYSGITYGVVTILADEPGGFGDREMDVLAQLSSSIGYAMTAIERRRALESDDTIELEFEGREMNLPFAQLARETACQVHHERTVRRQDGSVSVYYSVRGDLPEAGVDVAREILPGEVSVVSRDDELVVERQGSSWFGSLISEYGGVLREGRATTGGVTLLIELPQEADVRTIVERLQAAFPPLELTAKRQHRETASTPGELRSQLQQRLTDRQYEALETGHAMGYFEWPRENSGEEVAERLDITQPTVNKHIRLGEQKVFDFFFDGS